MLDKKGKLFRNNPRQIDFHLSPRTSLLVRGPSQWKIIGYAIAALISGTVIGLIVWLVLALFQPKDTPVKNPSSFEVTAGQSSATIAKNLSEQGLIRSGFVFRLYAKLTGKVIQIGIYSLSPAMSAKEIAQILGEGKVSAHLVTIPEGYAVWQIDQLLADKKILPAGEFKRIAQADEGYLFPDTYRIGLEQDGQQIRNLMVNNFNRRTQGLNVSRDVLIIASIVEREAKFDPDRAKIAAVFYNRLKAGLRLEADPTVQYARASWDPITAEDYRKVNSPYNTYLNSGLPPGPICNPGLKSIQAALNPDQSDFLYFFHLKDGRTIYSKTEVEHNENKKKYATER